MTNPVDEKTRVRIARVDAENNILEAVFMELILGESVTVDVVEKEGTIIDVKTVPTDEAG